MTEDWDVGSVAAVTRHTARDSDGAVTKECPLTVSVCHFANNSFVSCNKAVKS